MIAVIPLGPNRPSTLPYVLRALERNTDVTRVVTVGHPPTGITPDLHLPSPNNRRPYRNVLGHLRRVTETITEESFVWVDDDTFALKPWTPGVYVRPFSIAKHLRDHPNLGPYSQMIRATVRLISEAGHDPEATPCGPCHRPWLVDTARARATVAAVEPVGASFKGFYVAGLSGTIPVTESKIVGRGLPRPDAEVVSVYNDSWRHNAGRIIRQRFTEPSRWESASPHEDTAVAASGPAPAHHRHRRG